MKSDIRIVECEGLPPLVTNFQVLSIKYSDTGEVVSSSVIDAFSTMEDALSFCDSIYQATLKPVLTRNHKGEYE